MDSGRRWFILLVILAQIVGVLGVVLMIVWMGNFQGGFGWGKNNEFKFNYHPLFMSLGMILIYGDAILVYRVFRNEKKLFVKLLHMVMQLSAFGFAVVALVAVFSAHNDEGFANLYSLHSWMGLSTIILFGLQFVLGFVFYLFPQLSDSWKNMYMSTHRYWGVVIFCMAIGTALMGTVENTGFKVKTYSSRPPEAYVINFMGLCFVMYGWLVTYLVHKPEYQREESGMDYSPHLQDQ